MNEQLPFTRIRWVGSDARDYIGRCPFCGDSHNREHGHLHVSKFFPIYYCFRCNNTGSIRKLEEVLKEKCLIEYLVSTVKELSTLNASEILEQMNSYLHEVAPLLTFQEIEYFRKRARLQTMSTRTIVKFSLFPSSIVQSLNSMPGIKELRTWTIRAFGSGINGRVHHVLDKVTKRYLNVKSNVPWLSSIAEDAYIVRTSLLSKAPKIVPETLVVAEGIYDIVPIYLHRKQYLLDDKSAIFMASLGNAYNRSAKIFRLIYNNKPKKVVIFADAGISVEMLQEQFKDKSYDQQIIINWPQVKDWESAESIQFSVQI